MDYQSGHVMTLANSIIGVGILAMPYCFKQCGVILSIIILLVSSIISRLACHFLLKSAILARRKTFEFLAFHIFGSLGKFAIEVGMIGFLLGTAIAFFVVMGDLGPEILSEMTGVRSGSTMRNSIQIALAIFCVLPLGLLRNVDSLNGVSKATIGFYCCLVLKIIIEALPHLFSGDWLSEVVLWRPAGILQCLPIFSMALFCQTQLFEIYQSLPNASLEKMNSLIRVAVSICTSVYIFVGTFGYIAFFREPFTGNILLSFRPSMMSDVMKTGFVLSLAFSFPLVIFPCRASLYSLLYKGPSYSSLHEGSTATNYIPEGKFKMLTALIVLISLVIGIMIPNIELVLGLVGSTIGVMICVLFPVTCFICISPKNTNERLLAQVMLFVGIIVMVMGTYANLYAFEEAKLHIVTEKAIVKQEVVNNPKDVLSDMVQEILLNPKLDHEKVNVMDIPTTIKPSVKSIEVNKGIVALANSDNSPGKEEKKPANTKEVRHEPPQPEEPVENQPLESKKTKDLPQQEVSVVEKIDAKENQGAVPITVKENEQIKNGINDQSKTDQKNENEVVKEKQGPVVEPVFPNDEKVASHENGDKPIIVLETHEKNQKDLKEKSVIKESVKKSDEVDVEAIKKEDTELKEQEKEEKKQDDDTNQKLIDTIRKQNEVQQVIVEQQKKLIEVIQKQQENANINVIDKERLKAVKQIESIARKAIESIQNQDANTVVETQDEKKSNITQLVDKKSAANAAPLSYQLGLNQEKSKGEFQFNLAPRNLEPIPLAFAKSKSSVNATVVNKIGGVNKTNVEETKEINNELGKKKENFVEIKKESNEDSKLIGRDILSDSQKLERTKRDTKEFEGENLEVSQAPGTETSVIISREELMNKVCEEIGKSTSTEKPLIKVLCKLSDPALVNVDLKEIELQNVDLKPQKRDLKHVISN